MSGTEVEGTERPVTVERRTVLRAALATFLVGPATFLAIGCGDSSDSDASGGDGGQDGSDAGTDDAIGTADNLRPEVDADEAIVALGRRYRELRPDEDDQDRLQQALGLTDEAMASAAADDWLATTFATAVKEDFAENRVDIIDGWLLSKTELRAAALLSLL